MREYVVCEDQVPLTSQESLAVGVVLDLLTRTAHPLLHLWSHHQGSYLNHQLQDDVDGRRWDAKPLVFGGRPFESTFFKSSTLREPTSSSPGIKGEDRMIRYSFGLARMDSFLFYLLFSWSNWRYNIYHASLCIQSDHLTADPFQLTLPTLNSRPNRVMLITIPQDSHFVDSM